MGERAPENDAWCPIETPDAGLYALPCTGLLIDAMNRTGDTFVGRSEPLDSTWRKALPVPLREKDANAASAEYRNAFGTSCIVGLDGNELTPESIDQHDRDFACRTDAAKSE